MLTCFNNWDDEVKAKKLSVLLEGKATAIWFELTSEGQNFYNTAKEKIME